MTAVQLLAPAKINLSLRLFGRRSDGFHDIETTITPVSLSDVLQIERQTRWIDFTCDDPSIPTGDANLVVRAAQAFFQATAVSGGVAIKLRKVIPHGAGLGGGSSDAAATLLALNRIFQTGLPRETLARIAAGIGSDVPFFLFESAAICKGRGEIVLPLESKQPIPLLLLKPSFSVATGWAYSQWEQSRELPSVRYSSQNFAGLNLINDLERPVFQKFIFLAEMKTWLLSQPEVGAALMSGSGSTMFALLQKGANAQSLGERARGTLDPELWVYVTTTK